MKTPALIFWLLVSVGAKPFPPLKPSDMEAGIWEPDLVLLKTIVTYSLPDPNSILIHRIRGGVSEDAIYHYISAKEFGLYPEARSFLEEGGPGTNMFMVKMVPGPPQGFNYTIKAYGRYINGTSKSLAEDISKDLYI